MEIEKRLSGEEIILKPSGRIDTLTAPDLEATMIEATIEAANMCLDFVNVDYISSAGLRVLLSQKKKMSGNFRLINVNSSVMEILEMTGFTTIITIQ